MQKVKANKNQEVPCASSQDLLQWRYVVGCKSDWNGFRKEEEVKRPKQQDYIKLLNCLICQGASQRHRAAFYAVKILFLASWTSLHFESCNLPIFTSTFSQIKNSKEFSKDIIKDVFSLGDATFKYYKSQMRRELAGLPCFHRTSWPRSMFPSKAHKQIELLGWCHELGKGHCIA